MLGIIGSRGGVTLGPQGFSDTNILVLPTCLNSRWQASQHRVYIDRVGHWPSFLSLIPGETYKLATSEICDVTGHALFIYEMYLKYTFGWYCHFSRMYFKIKELRLKVVYFHAAFNQHKLTICIHLPPSVPTYMQ